MPVLVLEFDTVPVHDVVHKDFQFPGRKQSGTPGEISPHYLYHVVLAHLDLVCRELAEVYYPEKS